MELASNGYIVFALDHHDGSCAFTKNEKGNKTWMFDDSAKYLDYEDMNSKINIRINEV